MIVEVDLLVVESWNKTRKVACNKREILEHLCFCHEFSREGERPPWCGTTEPWFVGHLLVVGGQVTSLSFTINGRVIKFQLVTIDPHRRSWSGCTEGHTVDEVK